MNEEKDDVFDFEELEIDLNEAEKTIIKKQEEEKTVIKDNSTVPEADFDRERSELFCQLFGMDDENDDMRTVSRLIEETDELKNDDFYYKENEERPAPDEKDWKALYQEAQQELDRIKEQEAEPEKKKSVLFPVFCLICVIGIAFFCYKIVSAKTSKPEPFGGDDTQIILEDSPASSIDYKEFKGKALTAAQIANKCKKSNVGIGLMAGDTSCGQGSGMIMSEDSAHEYTYIITCAHVIDSSFTDMFVYYEEDGKMKSVPASIVGYDSKTDIGVIRVKKTGLECAEFGNSEKLVLGDEVYAIGNPGGMDYFGTITKGIVSDIGRPVDNKSGYSSVRIQHDASINPGNSGGMLVNSYGQVIGINSQKIANVDYEGMGFAIPISVAKPIIDNIIAHGYVAGRACLGIQYYNLNSSESYSLVAKMNKLPEGSVIIGGIDSASDFVHTDVQLYDIITSVNGTELTSSEILLKTVENGKVGDVLTLEICRIMSDYSIKKFVVEVKLVEDKGSSKSEQPPVLNPFEN